MSTEIQKTGGFSGNRVIGILAIALMLIVMATSIASAGTTISNIQFATYGYVTGNISNGSFHEGVTAGQIVANSGNLPLFCVDIYHDVNIGGTYTYNTVTKYDDRIGYLVNLKPTSATQSAGLQLAIWELTYETNKTSPYTLGTGNFLASNFSSSVISEANALLADSAGKHNVYLKYTNGIGCPQELVSPVPEPSSLLGLSMGFMSLAGYVMRKKK